MLKVTQFKESGKRHPLAWVFFFKIPEELAVRALETFMLPIPPVFNGFLLKMLCLKVLGNRQNSHFLSYS